MKQILITGVAGMIGSKLAEYLLAHYPEYEVIGIDNLSGGYQENLPKDVRFHQLDLVTDSLDEVFKDGQIEYVYHLAAYAAEGLSPFIRCFNYQNNLVATANVVNACIKYSVKRLVFTSSMAVYGIGTPPFSEAHQPSPVDPYGVAKFACEMDIQIAGEQHGLDWCIVRPHNVYGQHQNIWDKYRNVLGIWMYQKLNHEAFTVIGKGQQKRAFTYIEDCLEPLWQAATNEKASKEIINLGSSTETMVIDAAHLLQTIVGGSEIDHLEERHEVINAYSTHEKANTILGYKDKTHLKDGLRLMWEWAKQQPKRERKEWNSYELDKGLYGFWKK